MANPNAEESIFEFPGNHEKDKKYTQIERLGKTHWQSDYASDIFKSMQEQEQRRRPLVNLSAQLNERLETMQLLQGVTRSYKLSRCAFHLAMYYLDRFKDHYKIRADKFHLVGLICLHIAAQIEDTDAIIPRYSEMNRWVKDAYSASEYKIVERKILSFFNFEMIRPTTSSFVELFSCSFLTRTDFEEYIHMLDDYEGYHNILPYQRYGSFEQMLATLAQLLLRIANCTLSITSYGNEAPSLLAAACIAAVRQVNGVKRWSQYLINLTGYTEAQVEVYAETIIMYYNYQSSQDSVPEPEENELTISEPTTGQSNQKWSSPDSGFEEHLTTSTDFKEEPLTANTDFMEPLTANTNLMEPLIATTDFKEFSTAGTDFNESSTADTDFKENLTVSKEFKESVNVTEEYVLFENATTEFKESSTAGTDFKEPLIANADFMEPLILQSNTDFKESSTANANESLTVTKEYVVLENATTDFKESSTAGTDFKENLIVTKDFKESVTLTKEYVVLENGTALEVGTYSIITLELQEPAPTTAAPHREPSTSTLKRRRQDGDTETDAQPYKKPKLVTSTLKRRRQEDDTETDSQPYKKPKLVTEPND